jgi:phage baseplate assembly protein W
MALITLNGLPKNLNGGKQYLYADLHLDLEGSYNVGNTLYQKPEINDFKLDYDINAIKNSLANLFSTTPGEKVLNPEFGMDLRKYLFDPATRDVAENIRDEIYRQIAKFEPRVKIQNINITVLEDVNEFDITLVINIPSLNIINVPLLGTLNNNGYVFRQ